MIDYCEHHRIIRSDTSEQIFLLRESPSNVKNDASNPNIGAMIPFSQLRLRAKTLVQIRRNIDDDSSFDLQFCAAIAGRGLMFAPMSGQPMPIIKIGTSYRVSGFTGQHDFSFEMPVVGLFTTPFAYALLAYPDRVFARQVRQAMRVQTRIPAQLDPIQGQAISGQRGAILDISVNGALVETEHPLGDVGQMVRLSFVIAVEGEKIKIVSDCVICHQRAHEETGKSLIGLAFRALPRNERMALALYVQTLAEFTPSE